MRNHTLDEAIVEAARFIKAAKKLRTRLKDIAGVPPQYVPYTAHAVNKHKAEVERAALDCRYKLADLRAGR